MTGTNPPERSSHRPPADDAGDRRDSTPLRSARPPPERRESEPGGGGSLGGGSARSSLGRASRGAAPGRSRRNAGRPMPRASVAGAGLAQRLEARPHPGHSNPRGSVALGPSADSAPDAAAPDRSRGRPGVETDRSRSAFGAAHPDKGVSRRPTEIIQSRPPTRPTAAGAGVRGISDVCQKQGVDVMRQLS